MLDVKIKCLCLKYVKIVLEKCSKHHAFALIVTNTHNLVV